jgi:hypothetical protein
MSISDDELLAIVQDMQKWLGKSTVVQRNTITTIQAKLITADGHEIDKAIEVVNGKIPEKITTVFKQGVGTRFYERDFYRDYEYNEVVAKKPSTLNNVLKDFATAVKQQGYNDFLTIHITPTAFKKVFKELSDKEPPPEVTYIQLNYAVPLFIRYAPEKDKEPKLVLADDLKSLTLKQVIDLKLAQDKT